MSWELSLKAQAKRLELDCNNLLKKEWLSEGAIKMIEEIKLIAIDVLNGTFKKSSNWRNLINSWNELLVRIMGILENNKAK